MPTSIRFLVKMFVHSALYQSHLPCMQIENSMGQLRTISLA